MSDSDFQKLVDKMPALYAKLISSELMPMKAQKSWAGKKAVYVFYGSNDKACHVGRTRNLQQRVRAHSANSHNSASFAFKLTRKALNLPITYRKGEGRKDLLLRPEVRAEFDRQRELIRKMHIRFVEISDPLEQYLFELYAAMQMETSLSEFETS